MTYPSQTPAYVPYVAADQDRTQPSRHSAPPAMRPQQAPPLAPGADPAMILERLDAQRRLMIWTLIVSGCATVFSLAAAVFSGYTAYVVYRLVEGLRAAAEELSKLGS